VKGIGESKHKHGGGGTLRPDGPGGSSSPQPERSVLPLKRSIKKKILRNRERKGGTGRSTGGRTTCSTDRRIFFVVPDGEGFIIADCWGKGRICERGVERGGYDLERLRLKGKLRYSCK